MTKSGLLLGMAFAITVAAAPAVAAEENISANYILPGCKHVPAMASTTPRLDLATLNFKAAFCLGQVSAIAVVVPIVDAPIVVGPLSRDHNWCIPDSVTRGQMVQVVVRWIEERPKRMHEAFVVLTMLALQDAWPCPIKGER
jgi:Rap1a immunity proteins